MRIQFFSSFEQSLPYLKPLYEYIKEREPNWELYFKGKGDLSDLPTKGAKADLGIATDGMCNCRADKQICIFHGLASKGQAFSTNRKDRFKNYNGWLAVPSEYYKKLLLDLGVDEKKIFISGLTKHDNLERKILYAPTHHKRLSAIPVIKDKIYELDNLKVHLHNFTRNSDKCYHPEMRSYYDKHEDREDISDLLQESNVIIGDMGSILLEAIALGKQAIQVVNPKWKEFYKEKKNLKDEEVEKLPEVKIARKYATQVKSFEELKKALEFGSRIGNSCKIIYEKIKNEYN